MPELHHLIDALHAAYGTWGYPLVLVGAGYPVGESVGCCSASWGAQAWPSWLCAL